ncbi:hypothetical protein DPSP01_007341 [Paraphaeosphaeria sporulosa]
MDATTSYWDYSSEIQVRKFGVIFFQSGLLDKIEHRRFILHIQIIKAFRGRMDNLIHSLTALLVDLTPPSNNAAPTTHLRIANKHNLQVLAKQTRKLLYTATDKKHFDHAWWHDRNYPTTFTAMDRHQGTKHLGQDMSSHAHHEEAREAAVSLG